MSNRLLLIGGLAFTAAAGCSNPGAATADAGGGDLPPATVSFTRDVHPIVAVSCAVAGCHDTSMVMNHWSDYTTAEKTHMRWVNGPGFDFCTDEAANGVFTQRTTVVPGDPDASYLILKIAPPTDAPCQDPTHHRRMPPEPREPLSPASIATIVTWIREGARYN